MSQFKLHLTVLGHFLKGVIFCFSVSFNLQMMLQSQIAVLNDTKV